MNELEAYKFCPLCASNFAIESNRLLKCTNPLCGHTMYISSKPCNGVIVKNIHGDILLVKRALEPSKGLWDLAGGFVDIEENFEESVEREIQEELGVKVYDIHYLASYHDRYIYNSINYYTLGCVYVATVHDTCNIVASDDAESYAWFTKDTIPWQSLAFNSVKKALERYVMNLV